MASAQDFVCDVSGRYVSDCDPPVLVYLVAGVPAAAAPGASRLDVTAALEAGRLSPFLAALLQQGGRLELSAEIFDRVFGDQVDMTLLAPAFAAGGAKAAVDAAWRELRQLTQRDDLPGMVAKVRKALGPKKKKGG